MIIELPTTWRCCNCGTEIKTSGTQTAGDMERFSFRDSTMTHWCTQGQKSSPCEMVPKLDLAELAEALAPFLAALAPPKRGPGRPPKVTV